MFICLDTEQSSTNQGDTMPDGKYRNELDNILEITQIENNPDQEQEMVVARDHMLGTHEDVSKQTAIGEYLLVALRYAMREHQ